MSAPLLEARGVVKHFPRRGGLLRRPGPAVRAVDGVDLDVQRGETLGLVGESGSGKSTLGRTLLRLVEPTAGSIVFEGHELTRLGRRALRRVRPRMQIVFQDPHASLNPRMTVGHALLEVLAVNAIGPRAGRPARVRELLELVGLPARTAERHPHELSGGQRQRVGIARALATEPALVVADEAVAALDVSIQAQVVNLLCDLQDDLGLAYLFISHDLAMVRHVSDRVAVLYLGRLVEVGAVEAVAGRPLHPYTRALLAAVPVLDPERAAAHRPPPVAGEVPDPARPPAGCRFHPRCPSASGRCRTEAPALRDLGTAGQPHLVACHHAERLAGTAA